MNEDCPVIPEQRSNDNRVRIRSLMPKDAHAMMGLRKECIHHDPECFCVTFEEERRVGFAQVSDMLRRFYQSDHSRLWGAFFQEQLVGMIGLESLSGAMRCHRGIATGLCVKPIMRHKGVGEALIQVMIEHARLCQELKYLVLEVSERSEAAIRLYERQGFVHNGTEPEALSVNGKYLDVYRMCLKLHQ